MTKLARFQSADGSAQLVELDEEVLGTPPNDNKVNQSFDEVLANVQSTIKRILEAFVPLKALPNEEQFQILFGLKLNAEGGAVLARSPGEGQFLAFCCHCPKQPPSETTPG